MTPMRLALVAGLALVGCAPQGKPDPEPAGESLPHERFPSESARHVTFASGTTSLIVEGRLGPGEKTELVLGEEEGSLLMVHVVSPDVDLELSVHRMDTGEAVRDEDENPSFWIGRLPATLGYLVEVKGGPEETEYALEIEVPRVVHLDEETSSREIASWAPPHVPVAYLVPASSSPTLHVRLSSAPRRWYLSVHGLEDGRDLLAAAAGARELDGDVSGNQDYVVRVHPDGEGGDFTLSVALE